MGDSYERKTGQHLQDEVEAVASDKTRGEISEMIEKMKGPRKAINEFVVMQQEFVKGMSSPEAIEAAEICGPVVCEERANLLVLAQKLLNGLEHLRWLADERIAILRRQEALAKDKYGNERKPLELSPEEQELSYDLRGAAMRNSFEQTQAINRELEVTKRLQKARQEVYSAINQPTSSLSTKSTYQLMNWYKKQLSKANQRADLAEKKLRENQGNNSKQTGSSAPVSRVGPADVKELEEKLKECKREIDSLNNRLAEKERNLIFVQNKMRGSEDIMDQLAKMNQREKEKTMKLESELRKMTQNSLLHYEIEHRNLRRPPEPLPTTTGENLNPTD